MKPSSFTLAAVLLAALSGTITQTGCGGGSGDHTRAPETPVRVDAADVTYYFLPG